MKKWLILGGIAGIGFSFYYYFNQQLQLALNLSYRIKNLKVLSLTNKNATVSCEIAIKNNSSFQIKVKKYNLVFSFDGKQFAETSNNKPFVVTAESTFDVSAVGSVNLESVTDSILPFVMEVVKKQPINVQIDGFIEVEFMKLTHTIEINQKKITYSNNLLADLGAEKKFDKITEKLKNTLAKIGIKI